MGLSVSHRLDAIKGKPIAVKGEAIRNYIADADHRDLVGRVIRRTLQHSKLQPKDAAALMGYEDGGASISRWVSGAEPPCMWRLLRVQALRLGLVMALAELEDCAQVNAVITIPIGRQA